MVEKKHNLVAAFIDMRSKVARSIAGIVPQRDLEDVVQETFLRLQDVKNSTMIENPESFVYRTARNLALDHVKRAESRLADGHADVEGAAGVMELAEDDPTYREATSAEEFGEFCSAVHELPPQCRRVFVLHKVYGFSQREIAKSLSISESAVEKHVARGLKLTYLYLKEEQESTVAAASVTHIGDRGARKRKR